MFSTKSVCDSKAISISMSLTANATESFAELWALLRLVGNYLQVGAEILVVVGEPFQ